MAVAFRPACGMAGLLEPTYVHWIVYDHMLEREDRSL